MRNFQDIVFIWTRTYGEIFKSAFVVGLFCVKVRLMIKVCSINIKPQRPIYDPFIVWNQLLCDING